jgi:hypothetical protein
MKPVNEMSLQECLEALRDDEWSWTGSRELTGIRLAQVADRIHELTRWIPVEEGLPTKEDGDRHGIVEWWAEMEVAGPVSNYWDAHPHLPCVTHWRRITPPEGA